VSNFPIAGNTRFWVTQNGFTYRLQIDVPGTKADGSDNKIGKPSLTVQADLDEVDSVTVIDPVTLVATTTTLCNGDNDATFNGNKWQESGNLNSDPELFESFVVDLAEFTEELVDVDLCSVDSARCQFDSSICSADTTSCTFSTDFCSGSPANCDTLLDGSNDTCEVGELCTCAIGNKSTTGYLSADGTLFQNLKDPSDGLGEEGDFCTCTAGAKSVTGFLQADGTTLLDLQDTAGGACETGEFCTCDPAGNLASFSGNLIADGSLQTLTDQLGGSCEIGETCACTLPDTTIVNGVLQLDGTTLDTLLDQSLGSCDIGETCDCAFSTGTVISGVLNADGTIFTLADKQGGDCTLADNSCSCTLFDGTLAEGEPIVDPILGGVGFLNTLRKAEDSEDTPGHWNWTDVISEAQFQVVNPHVGFGWEGNYDSNVGSPVVGDDPRFLAAPVGLVVDRDEFFEDPPPTDPPLSWDPPILLKPIDETVYDPAGNHAMDQGDIIPFDWADNHKLELFRRLAPTYPALPDFRVATYFEDDPRSDGFVRLLDANLRPLIAADVSPLARAVNDFRCWYLGNTGTNATGQCKDTAFFTKGWEETACTEDDEFGCRKPYLIVIGDPEDNASQGEEFSKAGLRSWAINLGDPAGCDSGGGHHPIVQAGKGECITPDSPAALKAALQNILEQIRETSRAFSSAAVPTVQADVQQKVFLPQFIPLEGESRWPGRLASFLKPVPLDNVGRADFEFKCDGSGSTAQTDAGCLLWDMSEVMYDPANSGADQYDPTDFLDLTNANKRRVFYAGEARSGEWANADNRRLFDEAITTATGTDQTEIDLRFDLYRGLGIWPDPVVCPDPCSDPTTADLTGMPPAFNENPFTTAATNILNNTLSIRNATVDSIDNSGNPVMLNISFLLGDDFHSTPLVVAAPPNTTYFAADVGSDENEIDASCGGATPDKGYRCFSKQHLQRRNLIVFGADDGMLHAGDAGSFRVSGTDAITGETLDLEFDNGTGKELFAYMPRAVMPSVREIAESDVHIYTVDSPPVAADVFIDPIFDPASGPTAADREWRTVVVSGLRRGGKSYFALDLTQPDKITFDSTHGLFVPDGNALPNCMTAYNAADCGPVPYPSPLWEFTDSIYDAALDEFFLLDEDNNGIGDLGDSWSVPNLGRIRICKSGGANCSLSNPGDLIDKYVAIFGGGMDDTPTKSAEFSPGQGDWLYIVDIETGTPLYKRQLFRTDGAGNVLGTGGSAVAETAAVDTDRDGYIDRIYVPTLAGLVYRVDLSLAGFDFPELQTVTVNGLDDDPIDGGTDYAVQRITDAAWEPRIIFDSLGPSVADAGNGLPGGDVRRQFYHRPSVLFVPLLGQYGLALGTGDREDIFGLDPVTQHFYVFVDDTEWLGPPDNHPTPIGTAALANFTADAPFDDSVPDYLQTSAKGERGWFIELGDNEKVITDGFALSGVTFFSSFIPQVAVTDASGNPVEILCGVENDDPAVQSCENIGNSNVFVVNTTNGNGFLKDDAGLFQTRFKTVSSFITNPYTEQGQTKNTDGSGTGPSSTADDLTDNLRDVMETLKDLFPEACRFAGYRTDIKALAADTTLQFIAPVPTCIVVKNWREN
jgi:hypothetical protein